MKHAFSIHENTKEAVKEIKEQLKDFDAELLLYFTTIQHTPELLSSEMKKAFLRTEMVGVSSVGTMANGKIHDKGLAVMAFSNDAMKDLKIEILEEIGEKQNEKVKHAFEKFEQHFGETSNKWNHKKYVGLIFTNSSLNSSSSNTEEKIMESIGSLTNAFFVGGTAADDLAFEKSYIYYNEKYFQNACILVLLKPTMEFEIIKNQSFSPTEKKVMVTKANSDIREVIELNGRPVLDVYAELLNVSKDEVPNHFFMNPLGLVAEDDVYIRSPWKMTEENTLLFACSLLEGMEANLLKNGDIIGDMKKTLEKLVTNNEKINGILSFNCAYRLLELNAKNLKDDYAQLFHNIPTVGMHGYGEDFIGHINQTSTMLVFK